jgi:hypothetical protein
MIEGLRDYLKQCVPAWIHERCTDRFIGHVFLIVFAVVAAGLVSWFSVRVSLVLRQAVFGGFLFAVARFVFHERGTVVIASLAFIGVGLNDVVLPWVFVEGSVHFVSRLPLLAAMVVLESLEDEGLEEEVEAVEE